MKKSFVVLLCFATSTLFGQIERLSNSYLSVSPVITDADIINAASLVDPLAEKVKLFSPNTFSLNIMNIQRVPVMVHMEMKAFVTFEEDRIRQPIIHNAYTKDPFLISPTGRIFTSADAQEGVKSDISWYTDLNESLKKTLQDKITDPAAGGRVPSGVYEVYIKISTVTVNGEPPTDTQPIEIVRSLNITNPTTAILDVPYENGYEYPTTFPQFQWTYDTREVMLSIYELRPEHASLEDATTSPNPYLRVKIDRRMSGNLRTFTYPQSATSSPGITFLAGPRQLERGKVYVIVFDGIRKAFGFDIEPLRTIRSFVVADPQGQVVLNLLQNILSQGEFAGLINTLQNQKIIISTDWISLNGVKISAQDLQKILTENKDRIINARVED